MQPARVQEALIESLSINLNIINQEIQMNNSASSTKTTRRFGQTIVLIASIMTFLLLVGCGGTKVYKNDKTVVYNGAIYNLSNVAQINPKISGKLSDSNTVDLKGADRKQIEAYLKEYDSIYVRMAFDFDGKEMLYRASSVEKWSDYSKMQKSFNSANKQITSLMGDKKKMQLKLK